jgi:transcriptional regulator with GAF, ATPase, and Fis domain
MFDANRDGLARHSDSAGLSSGLIGSSPKFMAVFEEVRTVAPVDCAVLIRGEIGTCKELVARAIHTQSERRAAPFLKLNCAAIPAELLESELFGHEKGAFTRAVTQMLGRFEAANRGTLFLDEIRAVNLQATLLRVLVLIENKISTIVRTEFRVTGEGHDIQNL